MTSPYLPKEAEVVERVQESTTIFSLGLRMTDPEVHAGYRFQPGQFNMVYLYGVGEVPISLASDPEEEELLGHTVRVVGRVTRGLSRVQVGDRLGIRGPYGRGWPLEGARGRDVVLITGGLGCAPVVSVIHYVMRRRSQFRRLVIMQGVKHSEDLIWRRRYEEWDHQPNTQVLLAADVASPDWPGFEGPVTVLLDHAAFEAENTTALMCGPEIMMRFAAKGLLERGVREEEIWLSLERNMHCALGHCGHCQFGPHFVCRKGPVFRYPEAQPLLNVRGF